MNHSRFIGSDAIFHHGGGFRTASGKTVQLFEFLDSSLASIAKVVCLSQEESDFLYSQGAIENVDLDQLKLGQLELPL